MKHRIWLFHGDDAYAMGEARKKLEATAVEAAWRDFNYTALGPEASAGHAVSAVMTIPFGPGNRLVVVKDAPYLSGKVEDPGLQELEALLSAGLPPNAVLLFTAPKIDARLKVVKALLAAGGVREYAAPKPWQVTEQLTPWVAQLVARQGARIGPDAIAGLIEATGGDRFRVEREVEKLATAAEGSAITLALVRELVAGGEVEVFALTDALARKDAGGAYVALGKLLLTRHVLQVLATVATIVRGWAKIKGLAEQGLNPSAIASATGARSDFKVRKDLDALTRWRARELTVALDAFLDVDLAVKGGHWPPDAHRTLFERAIAKALTPSPGGSGRMAQQQQGRVR